jgi:hypothetical protein
MNKNRIINIAIVSVFIIVGIFAGTHAVTHIFSEKEGLLSISIVAAQFIVGALSTMILACCGIILGDLVEKKLKSK